MKPVYWDWLKKELGKAWGIIKLMPLAFWYLVKGIGSIIKEMTFNEIMSGLSWENLCVLSGCACCLCLVFGLILFPLLNLLQCLIAWTAAISLFLVSTYAYWRDKPDE